jgi:hypothetical protein
LNTLRLRQKSKILSGYQIGFSNAPQIRGIATQTSCATSMQESRSSES